LLIQNIIKKEDAQKIKDVIDNPHFSWYFQDNIIDNKPTDQISGFLHFFYKEGNIVCPTALMLIPLFVAFQEKTKLKIIDIVRVQANLILNQITNKKINKNSIHTDINYNEKRKFISLVYYVLDSDGDTIVYNKDMTEKERASPIINNLIWFKSHELHAATLPKLHKKRIVINSIVEVENTDILN
jgi:hypothetical protein